MKFSGQEKRESPHTTALEKGEQAYLWPAFLTWETHVSEAEQTAPFPQSVSADGPTREVAVATPTATAKKRITAQ